MKKLKIKWTYDFSGLTYKRYKVCTSEGELIGFVTVHKTWTLTKMYHVDLRIATRLRPQSISLPTKRLVNKFFKNALAHRVVEL